MAIKDYYLILGISRDEDPTGVRAAYRDLVKRHHPDVAGEAETSRFLEVREAYEVLSDPARRRSYNRRLTETERGFDELLGHPPAPSPEHVATPVERREHIRPSFEEFYESYTRNFAGTAPPKSEHTEGLNIEIVLSIEEAQHGGVLPVSLPVLTVCPTCGGIGGDWPFECSSCEGSGRILAERTVRIGIPPGVSNGAAIENSLERLGIHNFFLRVHVTVAG